MLCYVGGDLYLVRVCFDRNVRSCLLVAVYICCVFGRFFDLMGRLPTVARQFRSSARSDVYVRPALADRHDIPADECRCGLGCGNRHRHPDPDPHSICGHGGRALLLSIGQRPIDPDMVWAHRRSDTA